MGAAAVAGADSAALMPTCWLFSAWDSYTACWRRAYDLDAGGWWLDTAPMQAAAHITYQSHTRQLPINPSPSPHLPAHTLPLVPAPPSSLAFGLALLASSALPLPAAGERRWERKVQSELVKGVAVEILSVAHHDSHRLARGPASTAHPGTPRSDT